MNFLCLTIFFPLLSFLLLSFSQNKFSKGMSSFIGVSSVGLSFFTTIFIAYDFFLSHLKTFNKIMWTWINYDQQIINIGLTLDNLSLTMIFITTGVGLLINIFSIWYMKNENHGYARFFSYTNLFIANMIILVLADNMILMYFGWEGVGICSYLLIGFYHKKKKNCKSALKAFITTRFGDIFLIFAIFILFNELHTVNFYHMNELSHLHFQKNNIILQLITIFILLGAIGKSAQIPLHTWLTDAMVGPTPVSALIHAATMVTAGVYLIARNYYLFILTDDYVLNLISIIGSITLVLAGISALAQNNIKKILAYSTMSQIGYMFLSLGIKAWDAAIFHLTTHSFFKALLFISSGYVIKTCKNEQNIFKMGGLRKKLPFIYFCFLISGSSICAFPIFTSGFFSKEKILFSLLQYNNYYFLTAGLFGSFMTSLYIFRMIFIIFHGKKNCSININNLSFFTFLPFIILLILSSFIGGLMKLPLQNVFNNIETNHLNYIKFLNLNIVSSLITFLGAFFSFYVWSRNTFFSYKIKLFFSNKYFMNTCSLLNSVFNFIYNILFVIPFLFITKYLKNDPLKIITNFSIRLIFFINKKIIITSNGYIRWYITSVFFGSLLILTTIVLI